MVWLCDKSNSLAPIASCVINYLELNLFAYLPQAAKSLQFLKSRRQHSQRMADRPQGYGLTAELKEKQDSKYDTKLEKEAKEWLKAVVGEPFPAGTFHEALKDGVYLCKAINKLAPGTVPKINQGKMAFKMMENIGNFLDGCAHYGLQKTDSFQTVDLYEAANMSQVVTAIHALGRKARQKGFAGPTLGPKEASKQTRHQFSEEAARAGQSVIGLQMGSNKGATQSGMTPYGLQRQINKPTLR